MARGDSRYRTVHNLYDTYHKVAVNRKYYSYRLDALKQSLNQRATLIFDGRTPPFDLFLSFPTNSPSR